MDDEIEEKGWSRKRSHFSLVPLWLWSNLVGPRVPTCKKTLFHSQSDEFLLTVTVKYGMVIILTVV